jgi:hypothetical protein
MLCTFLGVSSGKGSLAGSQFENCSFGKVDFKEAALKRVVGIN